MYDLKQKKILKIFTVQDLNIVSYRTHFSFLVDAVAIQKDPSGHLRLYSAFFNKYPQTWQLYTVYCSWSSSWIRDWPNAHRCLLLAVPYRHKYSWVSSFFPPPWREIFDARRRVIDSDQEKRCGSVIVNVTTKAWIFIYFLVDHWQTTQTHNSY